MHFVAQFCMMKLCSLVLIVCTAARRFLPYEYYQYGPSRTLLQTTCYESPATGDCEGDANQFWLCKKCRIAACEHPCSKEQVGREAARPTTPVGCATVSSRCRITGHKTVFEMSCVFSFGMG